MGMAKGHWRRTRSVNDGYRTRHKKKPAKGLGIYAAQLPGVGPNGVHVQYDPKRESGMRCYCGGCSGAMAVAN